MSAAPEWVELTKANGDIEAHLIAGGLQTEGIETRLEKHPGVWRYGASDPFELISIYVHPAQLSKAETLLGEADPDAYEFEDTDSPQQVELPDPFIRNRSLRWWLAAFVAGGLILAMLRSAIPEVLF